VTATVENAPPSDVLVALLERGDATDPAVIVAEDGKKHAYSTLRTEVAALAAALTASGVRHGDRVAVICPDGFDFLVVLFALLQLGATAAPLNPAYKKEELEYYLDDLHPRFLLVPSAIYPTARGLGPDTMDAIELVQSSTGYPSIRGRGDTSSNADGRAAPDDTALLLHTSGTTSRPKQVPLLHRNLSASSHAIAAHYRLTAADVSYCAMPLFHVHGLVASVFATLSAGGCVIVPRRFSPRLFWATADLYRTTWLSAGPTLHQMILDKQAASPGPTTLRFVRSCSAPLSASLLERAEDAYQAPMLEAYGMTEASHQIASNPLPPAERRVGTVGVPTGVEVRLVDSAGADVGDSTAGEVVIRGLGVTPGYLGDPDANADSFIGDWLRTGDVGVFRDGYLTLEGRIKEMILRGGENISPYEIEAVLLRHDAVNDAVAFGMPDAKYGERVAAAVATNTEVSEKSLIAFVRERLAEFKVPDRFYLLETIPRTATGKLQRRRMAQMFTHGPK
jgi:acyl-CoA synthetase (AMP-forming)/AMP-acid ligase II